MNSIIRQLYIALQASILIIGLSSEIRATELEGSNSTASDQTNDSSLAITTDIHSLSKLLTTDEKPILNQENNPSEGSVSTTPDTHEQKITTETYRFHSLAHLATIASPFVTWYTNPTVSLIYHGFNATLSLLSGVCSIEYSSKSSLKDIFSMHKRITWEGVKENDGSDAYGLTWKMVVFFIAHKYYTSKNLDTQERLLNVSGINAIGAAFSWIGSLFSHS